MCIHDPNSNKSLSLKIQTQGYGMMQGSMNLCVIYRICFEAMTFICPNVKIELHKRKTTLFQVNLDKANLSIPKTITWSEIELPQSWKLEKVVPPKIIKRETKKIIENTNGDIEIIFGKPSISIPCSKGASSSSSSVKGIFLSNQQIPHGLYTDEPSAFEMEFRLNAYKYVPDRSKWSKEFMQDKNKNFRI